MIAFVMDLKKTNENNTITKLVGAQMAYGFTHDCYIV